MEKELWDRLAVQAARRYELDVSTLAFLAEETNWLYTVSNQKGDRYLLKLYPEGWKTATIVDMEAHVLRHIHEDGHVMVPSIYEAKDGSRIQTFTIEKDRVIQVMVYTWLEGDVLDERETDERFRQLGEVTARLHDATVRHPVATANTLPFWDSVFYFPDEKILYDKADQIMPDSFLDVMRIVVPYLNERLRAVYSGAEGELRLLHGDLNPWNVLVDGEKMHVIDFEDCLYGLPVHDIAIALYYYRYDDRFDFNHVKQLFFEGYERVLPLPRITDDMLELFMIARRVNFMNFVLQTEEAYAYIETSLPYVETFIKKQLT